MPQLLLICAPRTAVLIEQEEALDLDRRLFPLVEKVFRIEGEKDTGFTATRAFATRGEADVQVEIRYTAGKDEYKKGKIFKPTAKQQDKLADLILEEFAVFVKDHGLPSGYTVSAWIDPHFGGCFKTTKK